jgi:5-methylcytosine-specific restriction enzyme A
VLAEHLEERWNRHVTESDEAAPAEELRSANIYMEGGATAIPINRYERNPAVRRECIAHHGAVCVACGFSFERVYGSRGAGYIHVHHLEQLAGAKTAREVDPVRDLRPVCANCHAIIHRRQPMLSIEELRELLR